MAAGVWRSSGRRALGRHCGSRQPEGAGHRVAGRARRRAREGVACSSCCVRSAWPRDVSREGTLPVRDCSLLSGGG
ncbi:hypothetical protein GUJ93_ZPchr0003g17859 [Zizania palustris]|uniref:Uncharacterized protein n=1 Tax=Zizania palustris TaxID=103762 RepID=A0A8J5VE76_ZIZPA|nr:hypothetical protein GUJ93_ZPchr0003g17859 [Zizania palustris]